MSTQSIPDWRGVGRSAFVWRGLEPIPLCSFVTFVVKGLAFRPKAKVLMAQFFKDLAHIRRCDNLAKPPLKCNREVVNLDKATFRNHTYFAVLYVVEDSFDNCLPLFIPSDRGKPTCHP